MALVALAGACVTFPRAPDEGGSRWISVETPHFALATDMEKEPAEELARMLEDTWRAMEYVLRLFPGGGLEDVGGSERLLVIALKNDREREAVHKQLGGIFSAQTMLPPAISVGDIHAHRGPEVLQHELAHALLAKRLPRVPRWLTEGIAVYLQTAEMDREHHGVTWGTWNANDMRRMREYEINRVSVDALLDGARWKSTHDGYALQIEAGLLVHMLVNRYPVELACYMNRLATDLDLQGALACFPERARWTYEVKDYDYEAQSATRQAFVMFQEVQVSTTVLGDARVHALLAWLDYIVLPTIERQFQPDRLERAQRHLDRALEIDRAEQLALLLTLRHTEPHQALRLDLTKRLVDNHPDHWATWYARATAPGVLAAEQLHAIDRACELAPGRAEVLYLAAFRAFSESRWSDAREQAIKAWFGGIEDDINRALVHAASAQLGKCAEAQSWLPAPNDRKAFNAEVARIRKDVNAPPAPCPVAP
jgi:hypothetical protein